MPLAHRIIPTILCAGRKQVKGEKFNPWRSVGLAEQAVRVHGMRAVDEVVLLDVKATPEGRGPDLELVAELSTTIFAPLAVGGGVRTPADVRALLKAGADKVVIGTWAFKEPRLLQSLARTVGSQAVVVAIDHIEGKVVTHCGKTLTGVDVVSWATDAEIAGAGEIMLTAVDREGTQQGYDLRELRRVAGAVSIPVIAHGGCSGYQDMVNAVRAGASAVAAGALFQFTDCTPKGAAMFMQNSGIEVRI